MAFKEVLTTCAYCGAGCQIKFKVDEAANKIIEAVPADGRTNAGTLCLKGHYGWDYLNDPQILTKRLRKPMIRKDGKKSPLVEVSWDEAISFVAKKLTEIKETYGPDAIMGTGSNSCQYDGRQITKRIYSSGFILGDEGSAATLGKLFISDFLKGLVPQDIAEDFASRYPSDYRTIVANVYGSESSPSGYLGSFAPFIMEHYSHPYIKELVDGNFRSFFRRSIKQYDTEQYPVGIVGGFGYALKDIITRIASEEGVRISRFIKNPIDGLVEYHR